MQPQDFRKQLRHPVSFISTHCSYLSGSANPRAMGKMLLPPESGLQLSDVLSAKREPEETRWF